MLMRYFLFWMLVIAFGCQRAERHTVLSEEVKQLEQGAGTLQCTLQRLGTESQALWDRVAGQLAQELPEELPEAERKNMIAVRNANLLRMFQTYPTLPAHLQAQVDEAEAEDQAIAERMKAVKDSLSVFEQRINALLTRASEQQPDSLKVWQQRMSEFECF